jgi:hypothetical protein
MAACEFIALRGFIPMLDLGHFPHPGQHPAQNVRFPIRSVIGTLAQLIR